jgi:hypothetical protein
MHTIEGLTKAQRDELSDVHRELAKLHARINEVTREVIHSDHDADAMLDAQLSVSDSMGLLYKAMYPNG